MDLTNAQKAAIIARGNVLVIAGAGTGKTRTLVERCLACLLEEKPPVSFEDILMVTFTEAAAAEMRQRIRASLEKRMEEQPEWPRIRELLALFETSQIGTIHSFCLRLIRQHFYELDLDPQLAVLAPEEARLLAEETLDALLARYYAGGFPEAEAVQELVQIHGRGSDKAIRALVMHLHGYTQTLPDPVGWFKGQLEMFSAAKPRLWKDWLEEAIYGWHERWLPRLAQLPPENVVSRGCVQALSGLVPGASCVTQMPGVHALIREVVTACPHGKKTAWVAPLNSFLEEGDFLCSLCPAGDKDPLTEDWGWVRAQMRILIKLAEEFTAGFSEAKRELGVVDFHDLEQHALRLLWDPASASPKPIALEWRQRLRFVFVDEYQDINAAQDKILECVSREGEAADRFLVGDLKQSIYRFRLANPAIFQGYVQRWVGSEGRTIPLVDNFRSRESVLDFINDVFGLLMRREAGGVDYDAGAALRFGAPEQRIALSASATGPSVEMHLLLKRPAGFAPPSEEPGDAGADIQDLLDAEREARMLALRLKALKDEGFRVFEGGDFRPMTWKDVAVLLRSPSNKAESYAKEFARLGVPLIVARAGFYQSLEVSDMLSLLQLLDNPLQDLPAIAVLRSPLVGLSLSDLAEIRLAAKGRFWLALNRWHESQAARGGNPESSSGKPMPPSAGVSEAYAKVSLFLRRFRHWRRIARQSSLSRCLEAVLSESHFGEWLLTQPRGAQRNANVLRLVDLARQFDRFQRQSLFRFLRFVEAQQEARSEPEIAAATDEDAVRLLSIHQSKGLEFPIVAVADLGKTFNLSDLRADLILDEHYGLCPLVKPPQTGRRYPSLPYWLARQRQTRELLGEELRLLYVAMTRARDRLILSGIASEKRFFGGLESTNALTAEEILEGRSYSDWLGIWFTRHVPGGVPPSQQGEDALLRWQVHTDESLAPPSPGQSAEKQDAARLLPPQVLEQWKRVLDWRYSFQAATRRAAKGSVTAIRRQIAEDAEGEVLTGAAFDSRETQWPVQAVTPWPGTKRQPQKKASAAEIGTANHLFLQLHSLESAGSLADLQREAARLQAAEALTGQQVALLDLPGVARFWESPIGIRIRNHPPRVLRELPFTARFSTEELARLLRQPPEASLDGEFVVIQGVADLVVLLEDQIWLVDFKTDAVPIGLLDERVAFYRPQLALYSQALSRIYRRPVTDCWLYFISLGEPVNLQVASSTQP